MSEQKRIASVYEENSFKIFFEHNPVAILQKDFSALQRLKAKLQKYAVVNIRKYLFEHHDLVLDILRSIKIIKANKASFSLLEASSIPQMNRLWQSIFNKRYIEFYIGEFISFLEGKGHFESELRIKTSKGKWREVLLKESLPPQYQKNFKKVIVSLYDISDWKKLERKLRKKAQLDGLTELLNHNAITQRLEEEVQRAKRYGLSLSCLMVDLDNYKAVNDEFGHQKGDRVLKKVAKLLKNSIRKVDIIGRYGGDEFLIILPETSVENAKIVAKRLHHAFLMKTFRLAEISLLKIELSVGIGGYPSQGVLNSRDLISKADKALYISKRSERTQIFFKPH